MEVIIKPICEKQKCLYNQNRDSVFRRISCFYARLRSDRFL